MEEYISISLPLTNGEASSLEFRVRSAESVKGIVFREGTWQIEATFRPISNACPLCNGPLSHHGWSQSTYLDSPFEGQPVKLHAKRPRLLCRACKKTLTPIVMGLNEQQRVTDRLTNYIQNNLWFATSLRSLAASIGALPRTITTLLKSLANDSRETVLPPVEMGIHELRIGTQCHLIVSNLALRTVIDFLPAGEGQMRLLDSLIDRVARQGGLQAVLVPANPNIAQLVAIQCPQARISISLYSLHDLSSATIAGIGSSSSRKGKPGSVDRREAQRLAWLRYTELSKSDQIRSQTGIKDGNLFWEVFNAKEVLVNLLESADPLSWIEITLDWFRNLNPEQQVVFARMIASLKETQRFGAALTQDPIQEYVQQNLRKLQQLLSKPGRKFSPEMLAALFLASPMISVPIERTIGKKAAGPFWLEIQEKRGPSDGTHAGTYLETLVGLLLEMWDTTNPIV